MILKPRTGINVAVIFAGAVFVVIGLGSAIAMASVMSFLPAALGALGLFETTPRAFLSCSHAPR